MGEVFTPPAGREVALSADGKFAALLVIDLQNFTVKPEHTTEYQRNEALPRAIQATQKLQRAFRAAPGGEIIFTVIESLTLDGRDRGLDYRLSGFNITRGSHDSKVLSEIAPVGDEIVLPKTSSSVFMSTNLDYVLRALEVRQVVIVGGLTEQCISSAVRDACDLGYLVTLVTDGCVAKSAGLHEQGIRHIRGYCRQRTADEVVQELGGSISPEDPAAPWSLPTAGRATDTAGASFAPAPRPLSAKFVRLLWVDCAGQRRVRVLPIAKMHTGAGLAMASAIGTPAFADVLVEGSGVTATGEVRLLPAGSLRPCPWHGAHAFAFADMKLPGTAHEPWANCPRGMLTAALRRAEEECKLEIQAGFEVEFNLMQKTPDGSSDLLPVDRSLYCCSRAVDGCAGLLDEIVAALEVMGIGIVQFHAESGPGQFEISLAYKPALQAVEDFILAREAITGIAQKNGLVASFLPKLCKEAAGNGAHVHLSLWHDGKNVLMQESTAGGASETSSPFSEKGAHFVAGIVAKLPALLALTAPSPNSFRRLQPSCWSGAFQCWGVNNRECPVRACLDSGGAASHFEVKAFDATSNPYLGLAGIIVAGLHGLAQRTPLPVPVQRNPADSVTAQAVAEPNAEDCPDFVIAQAGAEPSAWGCPVPMLPNTVGQAADALADDAELSAFLGQELVKAMLAVRRAEEKQFPSGSSFEAEVAALALRY